MTSFLMISSRKVEFSCTSLLIDCSRTSILAICVLKWSNLACREAREASMARLRAGGLEGLRGLMVEPVGEGRDLLFFLLGIRGSS